MYSDIETTAAWRELTIAIVGGDEREQEIARLAIASGARVTAFGFPLPQAPIDGLAVAGSAGEALDGANIALFPIPGIADDGSLFATTPIVPDAALLARMASGAAVILGKADSNLTRAAAAAKVALHEYEADRQLMLLRAPAIVEGALQHAIELTDVTIHASSVCVVGQGNIGKVLTSTLNALGARVTVAARDPAQRAYAYTLGARTITTQALAEHAAEFDMLLSTVPAPLVTPEVIDALPGHALVMDLSAPPGGCDLDYARRTGRPAVWARALGRRAPVTVGRSQWLGIARIINGILEKGL